MAVQGGCGLLAELGQFVMVGGVYLLPEIIAVIQIQFLTCFYVPRGKDFYPSEARGRAYVCCVPGSESHIYCSARAFAIIHVTSFEVMITFCIEI